MNKQILKTLAPIVLLLLYCSISASAQTTPDAQGADQKANVVFKDTPVKAAVSSLGKQLTLNVVFDDTVMDYDKLNIELMDVSYEQALKIVFVAKRLQARFIDVRTIFVYPDNAMNREKFEIYKLWPAKSEGNK